MRRKASGAGRNCCQFAHLERVCVKVYPVDPQWDSNEKAALGLVKHQPRLPCLLPRCYGRFIKEWQYVSGKMLYLDILVQEWVGPTLKYFLRDLDLMATK